MIGADQSDVCAWFSVTDTGPDLPPEELRQIFGPLWQTKHENDRQIGSRVAFTKGDVEAQ